MNKKIFFLFSITTTLIKPETENIRPEAISEVTDAYISLLCINTLALSDPAPNQKDLFNSYFQCPEEDRRIAAKKLTTTEEIKKLKNLPNTHKTEAQQIEMKMILEEILLNQMKKFIVIQEKYNLTAKEIKTMIDQARETLEEKGHSLSPHPRSSTLNKNNTL